jgi:hypothetical protein
MYRYRLFSRTQHFIVSFKRCISIRNDHHQAFFYKILEIIVKCFYLRDLSNNGNVYVTLIL